jgi:hypothetical protein
LRSAACHAGFARTSRSQAKNSSIVRDGCAPGTSRQDTTAPAASDTTASHVARAFRSRSTRNACRSIASPSWKPRTTSLGGSWSATLTKSTSSPSARSRRTVATAVSISAGVNGSSGWATVRLAQLIVSMILTSGLA